MKPANAARGTCAPCQVREGIVRGQKVRLRVGGGGMEFVVLSQPVDDHPGGKERFLRLGYMALAGGFFQQCLVFVDPAMVEPVDGPTPGPRLADLPGDDHGGTAVVNPRNDRIRWERIAGNVDRSKDGRFEVEQDRDGAIGARDLWTGEEVTGLRCESSVQDWCLNRLDEAGLSWSESGGKWEARSRDGWFQIQRDRGQFVAVDNRFQLGGPSTDLRVSPHFASLDEAKTWCGVRASCAVQGSPGLKQSLRFEAIPF